MPKRRSRGRRWPPGSGKDLFFWNKGYRVYLVVGNHFQTRWYNYGTLLISRFKLWISKIRGFRYLGHFDPVDRSFDIMCLHFWIRSYSDWKCMDLPSWELHFWISRSWHILDTSSFHELLHLKFKRAHYQLIFPSTIVARRKCSCQHIEGNSFDASGQGYKLVEPCHL